MNDQRESHEPCSVCGNKPTRLVVVSINGERVCLSLCAGCADDVVEEKEDGG